MAVRLTVVMIQSPPPSAAAAQLTEGVIGELIGRPGIDMTLIGSLANLSEGSTDRLTLESLSGDVAVLDWQTPEAIADAFRAVGGTGHRWPHPGDPEAPRPADPKRRIYAFDLNRFEHAAAVCAAVKSLLASRQTRTFTLGGMPPAAEPSAAKQHPLSAGDGPGHGAGRGGDSAGPDHHAPPAEPTAGQSAAPAAGAAERSRANSTPAAAENPAPANSAAAAGDRQRRPAEASVDLDRLVDQLDELDP